jgi:hypothetical protein
LSKSFSWPEYFFLTLKKKIQFNLQCNAVKLSSTLAKNDKTTFKNKKKFYIKKMPWIYSFLFPANPEKRVRLKRCVSLMNNLTKATIS